MNTVEATPSTAINIHDAANDTTRGKALEAPAAAIPSAPAAPAAKPRRPFLAYFRKSKDTESWGWKRGLAVFDFFIRILAFLATLAAAIIMATTDETLPFFTEHYQFHAEYSDLPSLMFFVIANAIAAGFLVLSLPLSIAGICCPRISACRFLLFILDLVMLVVSTAAGAAAAAIVLLAHDGNEKTNWVAICLRFDGFCQQISGAVVASFVGTFFLVLILANSALAMRK